MGPGPQGCSSDGDKPITEVMVERLWERWAQEDLGWRVEWIRGGVGSSVMCGVRR